MKAGVQDKKCVVLPAEDVLNGRDFNIWDCGSGPKSSFNNRLHFHEFYEMSVIYEGTSVFVINGETHRMHAKSLQLIRPSDYHRQKTQKGEHIRYYNLMFTPDYLSEKLHRIITGREGSLCADATDAQWKYLLYTNRMIYENYQKTPEDELMGQWIKNNVENLCIFILQHQNTQKEFHEKSVVQEAVRRALVYVQKNNRKKIRLCDVAEAVGLSENYFCTLFHQTMGISFSAYLQKYRLQAAEQYLKNSELSGKEIAVLCGFASYPNFSSAFKKVYGEAPGQWRK